MRIITFKIPDSLLEELDLRAIKEGKSRSELLRDAITAYLRSAQHARRFRVKRITLS